MTTAPEISPATEEPIHREQSAAPSAGSHLAARMNRFTDGVTDPAAMKIGEFAETIQALHAELNMLAHHFRSLAETRVLAGSPDNEPPE